MQVRKAKPRPSGWRELGNRVSLYPRGFGSALNLSFPCAGAVLPQPGFRCHLPRGEKSGLRSEVWERGAGIDGDLSCLCGLGFGLRRGSLGSRQRTSISMLSIRFELRAPGPHLSATQERKDLAHSSIRRTGASPGVSRGTLALRARPSAQARRRLICSSIVLASGTVWRRASTTCSVARSVSV